MTKTPYDIILDELCEYLNLSLHDAQIISKAMLEKLTEGNMAMRYALYRFDGGTADVTPASLWGMTSSRSQEQWLAVVPAGIKALADNVSEEMVKALLNEISTDCFTGEWLDTSLAVKDSILAALIPREKTNG
mgnify:CR=1 FL=1